MVPPLKAVQEPKLPVTVLGATGFWEGVLEQVAAARKTVFLASYVYDNSKLQTKLLAAIARGVKVEMLVDRSALQENVAPWAKQRLEKLRASGAKVYVGSGRSYKRVFGVEGRPGKYHAKVVVVDGVVAFVGSPNYTNNSLVNGEVAVQVTGGAVATQLYNQAWAEAQRVESL